MIKKRVRILSFAEDEQNDIEYWNEQTITKKLETIQILRERYIHLFHKRELYIASRKGLRRICRVTKQA